MGKKDITLDKSQVKYRKSKKKKEINLQEELKKLYGEKIRKNKNG